MSEIAPLIVGSDKVISIFGQWPSFHDAEVHDLYLQRGHLDTEARIYEFPCLTVKLHHWLVTNAVDHRGCLTLRKHTLTTLKFLEVADFKMGGFNHQNAIFGLEIEHKTRSEGPSPYFTVDFDPSFGMGATFTCLRIEIVDTAPCDDDGKPAD